MVSIDTKIKTQEKHFINTESATIKTFGFTKVRYLLITIASKVPHKTLFQERTGFFI